MERTTINGAELAYEDLGNGAPVLLIHGTGACTPIWSDIPQRLAERHRVIAYDRRGFGESSGPRAKDLAQHADDAAALLEHLDARPATVVGWSGGGVIALMLAMSHPGHVASLVLSEPALHLSVHPRISTAIMTARASFERYIRRDSGAAATHMYRWVTPAGTRARAFDSFPDDWRRQMIANGPATVAEMDQQLLPRPRKRELASIGCPVTVMIGDLSEPVFPRLGRFLLKARPETRWVDLPGAGHTPHLDCPELFANTVSESAAAASPPAAEAREPDASAAQP